MKTFDTKRIHSSKYIFINKLMLTLFHFCYCGLLYKRNKKIKQVAECIENILGYVWVYHVGRESEIAVDIFPFKNIGRSH